MPAAVQIGNMRHCVQLQFPESLSSKRLPDGGWADDYDNLTDMWAEKDPKRGRSVFSDDRVSDEVMVRFMVWYDERITPECRAIYLNKVYNIKSVLPDNENKMMFLELVLKEDEPIGDNK